MRSIRELPGQSSFEAWEVASRGGFDFFAIYEAAGFTGARADQAAATVLTFVLGNALGPAAAATLTRKLSRGGGDPDELIREALAKASDIASQFPRLRARLESPSAGYAAGPKNGLEFGLQAILDGLDAHRTSG